VVKGSSERFLFFWLVGFVFQRLLLLSVHLAAARAPFDQCDLMEEELEAAQSITRAVNTEGRTDRARKI
jgi:hypothetical protein